MPMKLHTTARRSRGETVCTVTNRRLGNVDLTVTKEWQDGSQLQELLKGSNVVPVVKLVFDEEKNNAAAARKRQQPNRL